MKKGVRLEEGIAKADKIHPVKSPKEIRGAKQFHGVKKISDNTFSLILHQGWKRQIRRMCKELNYSVLDLKRIRIEKIKLGDLKIGKYIKKDKIKLGE